LAVSTTVMFPFYASERASSKNRERRKFFDSKRPRLSFAPTFVIVLRNNRTAICDIFFFESSSSEIETFARTRNERVIIAHEKKKKKRRRNQNRASSPPPPPRERERVLSSPRIFFFSASLFSLVRALFFGYSVVRRSASSGGCAFKRIIIFAFLFVRSSSKSPTMMRAGREK